MGSLIDDLETWGAIRAKLNSVIDEVTGATDLSASIPSPLSSVAYANEPVAIGVSYDQGQVPSADYLKVLDASGAPVAFQWEPATHPKTGADVSTWPGGSLKAGTLWVLAPAIAAGATVSYSVEIKDQAQNHAFVANVAHTVVSGTVERLDTPTQRYSFENAQAWMCRRIYDQTISNEDYFTGQNGVSIRADFAGVANYSHNTGDVAQLSHAQRFSTAFGAGVVFREWETQFSWVNEPNLRTRVRYRVWANGKCDIDAYHWATGALASNARRLQMLIALQSTGTPTATANENEAFVRVEYSNKRILIGTRFLQVRYEATPEGTHTRDVTYAVLSSFGWTATTAIPSGAYFSQIMFITPAYTLADHDNEVLRRRNPLHVSASPLYKDELRAQYQELSEGLTQKFVTWYPLQSNVDWLGVMPVARIGLDLANYATAIADWTAWLAGNGYDGTAASYYAAWLGNLTGIEYLGRNLQGAASLYDAAEALGITPNPWAAAVHAAADFYVLAEVQSGSNGSLFLHGSGPAQADNFNAEASGLSGLAKSLSIAPHPTRQATFNRLWARLKTGFENVNRMPYSKSLGGSNPNQTVISPQFHYFCYQLFEMLLAYQHLPGSMPGFTLRPAHFIMDATTPLGQVWERQNSINPDRRGTLSTQIYAAACLMMTPNPSRSEMAHAVQLLRYVYDNLDPSPTGLWTSPVDGWAYPAGSLGQGMDVRALVASLA